MEAHEEATWLSQLSMTLLTIVLLHEGKPTPQERDIEIVLDRALIAQAEDLVGRLVSAVRER
jgi:hypothetical protein